MELDKFCNIEITGKIEHGKQFDLDIELPNDERNVIYGIVKDTYGNFIENAVVKLIEIVKDGRKPVSHTFTDIHGEFLFGPLCPGKIYAIEIWANKVEHIKICKTCHNKNECLKGIKINCDECKSHLEKEFNASKKEKEYVELDDIEIYEKND